MSEDLTQPLPNDGVQLILKSLENLNGRMTRWKIKLTGACRKPARSGSKT